jgi:hypothetical protein
MGRQLVMEQVQRVTVKTLDQVSVSRTLQGQRCRAEITLFEMGVRSKLR